MMLFSSKKITAIDIGSYSIKLISLKRNKKGIELTHAGMIELPPDSVREGEVIDTTIIASNLEDLFWRLGFKPGRVVTTISNQNVVIRSIKLPVMTEEELTEALKWEAEDYLPFSVENAAMDYLIVSKDETEMELLLVAVPQKTIKSFLAPLERLAIKPLAVNVQPMALLTLLHYQNKSNEPMAIIDIGAANTMVVIGDKNKIYLSRTISIGGKEFTTSLMDGMNLDFEEAEHLKKEKGIEGREETGEETDFDLVLAQLVSSSFGYSELLLSVAQNLAAEITRSLEYFTMQNKGQTVERFYVTGGGSKLKGLKELIAREIEMDLTLLDPFAGLELRLQSGEESAVEYAVAIGLGLSEVLTSEG